MPKAYLEFLVPRGESFIAFVRDEESFPFEWHYHPDYEIVATLEGAGEVFVGDHLDLYREGELVMTGPNLPHAWSSKPQAGRNRAGVIQFSQNGLGSGFFDRPEMSAVRHLLAESARGLAFSGSTRTKALEIITGLLEAKGVGRLVKLLELLDVLAGANKDQRRLSSRQIEPAQDEEVLGRFERAFGMIVTHYREPLRQREVAKSVHMTSETFSRMFTKRFGKGFRQCLIEYRVAMACRLLQETDLLVTEICYQCGFQNLANFNRQFLRLKKCPPRSYRSHWR